MDKITKQKLREFLLTYITDERKALFEKILQNRTRHITILLENIYQPHNASAVLRSCDLTGVQDVHIVENTNSYEVNPEVAMGSAKWLDLIKYSDGDDNTTDAIKSLKDKGYRIIATTPHKDSFGPHDLPLNEKAALLFGTELTGLSQKALDMADDYLTIPQYGFTESYNISVSVALSLFTITQRLRASHIPWHLSQEEKDDILLEWARRTIKRSEVIEAHFLKNLK